MATSLKPSSKYEHLYAIIRYENEADENLPVDLRITVKKVVTDGNYAAQEVARLNELNADKGAYYFAQDTRFEAPPVHVVAVPPVEVSDAHERESRPT